MKLRFLGIHNSESLNTGLMSLIIDDVLAVDAGSLATALSFEEQERIRAILISHGHYDHIRDLPAFAFNNMEHVTSVYGTHHTLKLLSVHILNGEVYPKFFTRSSFIGKPILKECDIKPLKIYDIEGFTVLPVSLNHIPGSVGFEITDSAGKSILYATDTGPDFSFFKHTVHPDVIIIDVTFPDNKSETAENSRHLTPELLKRGLDEFYQYKSYMPEILPVHLHPKYEIEIRNELDVIADQLKFKICALDKNSELIL